MKAILGALALSMAALALPSAADAGATLDQNARSVNE